MKKVVTSAIIFIISIILYISPVHAYGFNLGVETSNDVIIKGGTLKLTVSTKNFDFGSQGIDACTGVIEYSTDVFETLTSEDIEGKNGWGISYNNGKILCVPSSSGYITEEGDLFTITFKIKENATMGETNISVKDFMINDAASGERITTDDVIKTVSVKSISSNVYKFDGDKITGIKANTKVEDFKNNILGTGIQVFNQSGTELTTGQIVGTGMTMKSGTETYTLIVSGDLNGDGAISATDLSKIKMHIIELRLLEGAYLYAANVDGDENVTITDLSKIRKAFFGEIEL